MQIHPFMFLIYVSRRWYVGKGSRLRRIPSTRPIALADVDCHKLLHVVHYRLWDPERDECYNEVGHRGKLPKATDFLERAFSLKGNPSSAIRQGIAVAPDVLSAYPELGGFLASKGIPIKRPGFTFTFAKKMLHLWESETLSRLSTDIPFQEVVFDDLTR